MLNLFYMGGPLFMGILTLIFFIILIAAVLSVRPVFGEEKETGEVTRRLAYIKSIGLFALVVGVLGQLIGLYDAFKVIEQVGSISPAILAGGLKVSLITTIYGLFIYILSFLIWAGLSFRLRNNETK